MRFPKLQTFLPAVLLAAGTVGAAVPATMSVTHVSTNVAGAHCRSLALDATGKVNHKLGTTRYDAVLRQLRQDGLSDDAIASTVAEKYCVVRNQVSVSEFSLVSSSNGDVKVTQYVDHDTQAHLWYATGQWNWLNDNYVNDVGGTSGNLGYPEAVATSFNSGILLKGASASWWGKTTYFPTGSTSAASSANGYGAGFKIQDKFLDTVDPSGYTVRDLNMYHGQIIVSFVARSGCISGFQAFTEYSHTWSSTSISGISVGPWSAGISWSSNTNHWERVGYNTTGYYVCTS